MSIACEEEKLFKELRRGNPDIVEDGIVDEHEYLSAKYQIVYVLKEVNGGSKWNLKEFLYSGGRRQTWDNIARWTEAILNVDEPRTWQYWENACEARRQTYLKKIGAVNLKKTSGGHTAKGQEIFHAAIDNSNFLQKQLRLYQPDFIICCGTIDAFVASNYSDVNLQWKMTSRGIWYFNDGHTIVISFSHPEARVKDCVLHYALVDAVKEIVETNEIT